MPKQPRIRINYLADSQYLLRLVHALESDTARSVEWRRETIELVQTLAYRFLETRGKENEEEVKTTSQERFKEDPIEDEEEKEETISDGR